MDNYTILCAELRGSGQSLNGNIETLQAKAAKLQKAIDKVTRGDYKTSDLNSAYAAQRTLTRSITRLGEICGAMTAAAEQFSEASAELSGRANLTAYYMQHTDTLSYEGLMGSYSAAISAAGGAVAGYELVKGSLAESGYAVGSLGSVSNAVQDAMRKEAEAQAKEAEERAERAKWAKIGLTAAVVVIGGAASLITGGAAAPIVIGAISGAVMAGGNTAIDQYAEHGWEMDKWDYAEIGKDAFVGGVTGAVTAWIGGNVTKGFTKVASNSRHLSALMNNSNPFVRVGTGAAIGSVSEVVSGVGTRGATSFITTMVESEGDLGESLSAAGDSAFDLKQMLVDAARGGVQGGRQQYKELKQTANVETTTSVKDVAHEQQFAPDVEIEQSRINESRYYSKGDHHEEFQRFYENDSGYEYTPRESREITYVRARDVEGVYLFDSEVQDPQGFWTRHGRAGYSQENIMRKASAIAEIRTKLDAGMSLDDIAADPNLADTVGSYFRRPVVVNKVGDFFEFCDEGRHRTIAAQSIDVEIPVIIKGEYIPR